MTATMRTTSAKTEATGIPGATAASSRTLPTSPASPGWVSYARASSDEQTTSCGQQHVENERAGGHPPAARFEDDGVRGSVEVDERPGFLAMLSFLRAHRPGSFVVRVYDTSRLGRFLRAAEDHFFAKKLLRRAGAKAILYTRGGGIGEKRTTASDVQEVLEADGNLLYSKKLSEVVHRGLIEAVREGKRSGGVPPHGYDLEYAGFDGRPWARVRFVPVPGEVRAYEKHVTYLGGGASGGPGVESGGTTPATPGATSFSPAVAHRVEVVGPEHRFRPPTKRARSRLVLGDPRRIDAVRFVFDAYMRGRSFRGIAQDLARLGWPSPEGTGWSIQGVRSILTNPLYTGRMVYGRRSESKYHALEAGGALRALEDGEREGKKQWHMRDEGRWVAVEGAHEAIVTDELWRAANERRERRGEGMGPVGGAARGRPSLLSGLLFCPLCGRKYVAARKKNSKGVVTGYYRCGTYDRGGDCKAPLVREEAADGAVLDFLSEGFCAGIAEAELRRELRQALMEEAAQATAAATSGSGRRAGRGASSSGAGAGAGASAAESPAAELAAVEREIRGIVEGVSAENLPLFDERLGRLRRRKEELAAAIAGKGGSAGAGAGAGGSGEGSRAPRRAFNLEAEIERAIGVARRLRELLARIGETAGAEASAEAVLELRETVLVDIVKRAEPFPERGIMELEVRTDKLLEVPEGAGLPAGEEKGKKVRTAAGSTVGGADGRGERRRTAPPTRPSLVRIAWPLRKILRPFGRRKAS